MIKTQHPYYSDTPKARRIRYRENRAKILRQQKRYRLRHIDAVRNRDRKRYPKRRVKHLAKARLWYLKNRRRILIKRKRDYKNLTKAQKRKERERLRTYRKTPKGKKAHRSDHYRNRHGITLEDVSIMAKAQGGVCAICHNGAPKIYRSGTVSRSLSVDHCHKTGKVRGLLCHKCNSGLGMFGDDLNRLRSAISYLNLHSSS